MQLLGKICRQGGSQPQLMLPEAEAARPRSTQDVEQCNAHPQAGGRALLRSQRGDPLAHRRQALFSNSKAGGYL